MDCQVTPGSVGVIAVGTILGGVMGSIGALTLALINGPLTSLVPWIMLFAAFSGAVGGLVSGLTTLLLARPPRPRTIASNVRMAFVGSLIAGVSTYLFFFFRQSQQSPVLMILGPAAVLSLALGSLLTASPATSERKSLFWPKAQRLNIISLSFILGASAMSLCAVLLIAFVLVPESISSVPLSADFELLQPRQRSEVLLRAAIVVAISTILTAVATTRAGGARKRTVALVLLVFGTTAVNVSWLAASVSLPLSILHQREEPLLTAEIVVSAIGWLCVAGWLVFAVQFVRREPLGLEHIGPGQAA